MKSYIVGAGGHARVIVSMLEANNIQIGGIYDLGDSYNEDECILGIPVIGGRGELESLRAPAKLYLAIGNNQIRKNWYELLKARNFTFPNLISPSACIDESVLIGDANIICYGSYIGPAARVGVNNIINTMVIVEHESVVESHCHLAPRSSLMGRVRISESTFIGAGSIVIDSISIAQHTIVGAGAVIVNNIEASNGVYVGIPARPLKKLDDGMAN